MSRTPPAQAWLKRCVQTYLDGAKEMLIVGTPLDELTKLELEALVSYLQRERERLKKQLDAVL